MEASAAPSVVVGRPEPRYPALGQIAAVDVVISLVVAFNFAVTQPLLDLLGRNAPFFIAHDLGSGQIIAIALLLAAIIPLVAAGILLVVRRLLPRLARAIHLAVLAALLGALVLSIIGRLLPFPDLALISIAVALGSSGALAYAYTRPIRIFMRFSLIGPVAFLLFFLMASPVSALIGSSGGTSTAAASVRNPAPVVVIMLDEFPLASILDREGDIDESRYPNFARLADRSTWFRNATTVHTSTTFALPSLLTGELPQSADALPIARDHPQNLFQRLANTYDMVAIEPVSKFCVYESCRSADGEGTGSDGDLSAAVADLGVVYGHIVLPPRLRRALPDIDGQWAGFVGRAGPEREAPTDDRSKSPTAGAEPTPDRTELVAEHRARFEEVPKADKLAPFDNFLASLGAGVKPTLYFGHFMLPHAPWVYLPSGDRHTDDLRSSPGRADSKTWGADEWQVSHAYRRHLLQVQLTDRLLGQLLDRLQEEDLFEDSLVIVVSDHGTTFQLKERRRSTSPDALGEVAYVPFFVKTPGQNVGHVSDAPTQIIDVLPTILDVLDSDQQDTIDGRSVFDTEATPRTTFQIHKGSRVEEYPANDQPLREAVERKYQLFSLDDDPGALFRFGPFGDLVGEEAASFLNAVDRAMTVQIPQAELPSNVEPGSGLVPALVRGVVHLEDGDEVAPTFLALSLDGTIGAIAKTYVDQDGTVRFETLLNPHYLESGDNRLDVYRIGEGPNRPKLIQVLLEGV